ncbi:MAG: hypothetical protein QW727_02070 [Candidatus Pacearchaeota archaeon]
MFFMSDDFFNEKPSKIKRAVIAGASEALKYKSKDWNKRDEEIIQDITKRINEIIERID